MKMRLWLIWGVTLFTLLAPVHGSANGKVGHGKKLKVGYLQNLFPFEKEGRNKQPAGYSIDIMNFIAEENGYRISFVPFTIGEAIEALDRHQIDIAVFMRESKSSAGQYSNLLFSRPFGHITIGIYTMSDDVTVFHRLDLSGKKIGVLKVLFSESMLREYEGSTVIEYDSLSEMLRGLEMRQIDCFVHPDISIQLHSEKLQLKDKIRVLTQPLDEVYYTLALANENIELARQIDHTIAAMTESGKLAEIENKWLHPEEFHQAIGFRLIIFILAAIIFISVSALLFLSYRSLKAGGKILNQTKKVEHLQFLLVFIVIVGSVTAVTMFSLLMLYDDLNKEIKITLESQAASYAHYIEKNAFQYLDIYPREKAKQMTIQVIQSGLPLLLGKAEITVAMKDGEFIEFLLRQKSFSRYQKFRLPFDSPLAEPMHQALSQKSGSITGVDYSGTLVLAGFHPVFPFDLGIVVKMDLDETFYPFFRTAFISLLMILLFTLAGAYAYRVINRQLIVNLNRSRDALLNFFNQPLTLNLVVGQDNMIYGANSAWELSLGYRQNDLIGKSFLDLLHPDDKPYTITEMESAKKGDQTFYFENRILHRNGAYHILAWSAHLSTADNLIYTIAYDVTERVEILDRLGETERKLEYLFENLPIAIVIYKADKTVKFCNPIASELLGLTNEFGLLGDSIPGHFVDEDLHPLPSEEDPVMQVTRSKKQINNKIIGIAYPGKENITWVLVNGFPITDDSERIVEIILSFTDVTDEVESRKKLKKSQELFRMLTEFNQDWIYWINENGQIIYMSSSCERITGYEVNELIENPLIITEIVYREDRELWNKFDARRNEMPLRGGTEPVMLQFRIYTKNHLVRWIEHISAPSYDETNAFKGFRTVNRDITSRKLHEEYVLLQNRRARALLDLPQRINELNEYQFMQYGLDLIEELTDSKTGYSHFVSKENESVLLAKWSLHKGCSRKYVEQGCHPSYLAASVWLRAFYRKRPVIQNGGMKGIYKGIADSSGANEKRLMVIPLLEAGRVVLIAGLGNKSERFTQVDAETSQLIFSEMWRILQNKRSAEKIVQLSQIVEQSPESIVMTNTHGDIEYVNNAALKVSEFSLDEVIGNNPRMFQSGNTPTMTYKDMWSTINNGGVWQGRFYNRSKSGVDYIENAIVSPLRSGDNTITHYFAVKENITESVRIAEALHESELYNRKLFEQSLIGLLLYRPNGEIIDLNQAFAEFVGHDIDKLRKIKIWKLTPPDFRSQEKKMLNKMLIEGNYISYEKEFIHKKGHKVPVRLYASYFIKNSEKLVWSLAQDITEEKFNQAKLLHSSKLATIGAMATGIAHELNQPLNIIKMSAQLLQSSIAENDFEPNFYGERAEKIVRQVDRASRVIKHVLQYGRKSDVNHAFEQMNDIILNSLDLVREKLRLHGVTAQLELAEELPSLLCDKLSMEQVFVNLLLNGIDALDQAGTGRQKLLSFKTWHDSKKNSIVAEVSDTGSGIPQDIIEHIFQAFYTTKEAGKGTGLGLSISSGIIQEHNGKISVKSRQGEGSTFRIVLPVRKNEEKRRNDI